MFLDWLFVAVFSWGVAGASWATTISQTLSAVLIVVHLFSTKREYRIHLKRLRIHKKQMMRIVKLGVPAGIQSSLLTISNIDVYKRQELTQTKQKNWKVIKTLHCKLFRTPALL